MSKHPFDTFYIPLLLGLAAVLLPFAFVDGLAMWITVSLCTIAGLLVALAWVLAYRTRKSASLLSRGGQGGAAKSFGNGNNVTGGKGGDANTGIGGSGGNALVKGNNSVAKGGDGGSG